MALEAYAQFHAFDWANNKEWLAYKANLEIPPESGAFLRLKREKWFKDNMNADYDPTFTPTNKTKETTNGSAAKSESGSSDDEGSDKPAKKVLRPKMSLGRVLVLLNSVLSALNIVLGLVNLVYPCLLGLTHLVLAYLHAMISYAIILFLAVGRPQFNMDWLKSCLQNDNMHYILYCLMFFTTMEPRPVSLAPLLIYSVVNISILLPQFCNTYVQPISLVNRLSSAIKEHKTRLLAMGANLELAVFASIIFEVFSGDWAALLPVLMFWNFLTSRYQASVWTRSSVGQLEATLDGFLLSTKCPSIVTGLYLQIKALIKRLGTPRTSVRYA